MKKNAGSQVVGAQMVSASDGSAFTGSVTVYVTGDGGTQAAGSVSSGACTHEGNGFHTYVPAQAETNYDHVAFTFTGSGAIPQTVQIYTSFPQTADVASGVNVTSISGDSTAADNLEAMLDGTGSVTISADLDGSVGSVTGAINTAAGTITTLDGLDTAQDTQHSATQSAISTAQADLDTITGSDGVTLATSQGNYAPATASALSTVDSNVDAIKLVTDALTSTAAGRLAASAAGIIPGAAQTGSLSTTSITTDLSGYADDQLIGRVIIFTSGDADGEAREITDYASTNGVVTFSALTTAPANTDTFVIV